MLVTGVLEGGSGVANATDRRIAVGAAVVAVSLSATAGYLAVVALIDNGLSSDVLVWDVGLAALA